MGPTSKFYFASFILLPHIKMTNYQAKYDFVSKKLIIPWIKLFFWAVAMRFSWLSDLQTNVSQINISKSRYKQSAAKPTTQMLTH